MIQGFWQTDYELLAPIRASGCALLSSIYLAARDFTQQDCNDMYNGLLGVKFIEQDCTIDDWDKVLNSIAPNMHFKAKSNQFYVCAVNEREIIKWYLSNVKEDHFTVGNGASKIAWDSMNRPDIMSKYATFVEKVVVTVA